VAKEEGLTVSEYARRAGLAQGVMTRNPFDLGEYNRRKDPGLLCKRPVSGASWFETRRERRSSP